MATATPLDFPPAPPDMSKLSPEDAAYLASFMAFVEEDEKQNPGFLDAEIEATRKYQGDLQRELADIEAGCHPLQLWAKNR